MVNKTFCEICIWILFHFFSHNGTVQWLIFKLVLRSLHIARPEKSWDSQSFFFKEGCFTQSCAEVKSKKEKKKIITKICTTFAGNILSRDKNSKCFCSDGSRRRRRRKSFCTSFSNKIDKILSRVMLNLLKNKEFLV